MVRRKKFISPLLFPILFFGIAIVSGAVLLYLDGTTSEGRISWIDALFTATSATCVTGLAVLDTGSAFSRYGQEVILFLIQIGGLGVMTLASLAMYLLRQRVSLTDRIAVGQNLLHDSGFRLGRFLIAIVLITLLIEGIGAGLLYVLLPGEITPFSAIFHAVSAFCNAGFSLNADSLMPWHDRWGVNFVFIGLIIIGGIGFSVIVESLKWVESRLPGKNKRKRLRFSWYSRVVLSTSAMLVIGGAAVLFFTEHIAFTRGVPLSTAALTSLFQSVTCRTAGFNTVEIREMTNVSLLVMMFLMMVGGAPGSTAGGIKVTTLRVMAAFYRAHLVGRRQAVIGNIAAGRQTVNKALTLALYSLLLVSFAVLLLHITEGGDLPHAGSRGLLLEIGFEVTSALGTAGLSTGLTSVLTVPGKCIIMLLMFIGRLGPLIFLAVVQEYQKEELIARPESDLLIG
jgi:trk system potassium uptake protein TrkH